MFGLIVGIGVGMMVLERLIPDQDLPHSTGWWLRAVAFNAGQLAVVIIGGLAWDVYLQQWSIFVLSEWIAHPIAQGFIGYLLSTFIYYWWHRFRHMSSFLWQTLHQIHHSPVRIEIITAFYKHPFELITNSILSGLISYTCLGLSIEAAAWMTLFSALGEFFYHMNIATPRWVGWFIQRPEMHRIHHQRHVHASNYGDLPIWDMLFGTYSNPPTYQGECGFEPPREQQVMSMLFMKDVNVVSEHASK